MKATTQFRIEGELVLRVRHTDGSENVFVKKNLVVNFGTALMAKYLSGGTVSTPMNQIAVGTGSTAPVVGNTALVAEVSRKLASVVQGSGGDANKVTFQASWASGAVVATLQEAGIFDAASAGNMFSRVVFAPVVVGALDTLIATWTVTFTGV